jgi:hypothetical protein
MNETKDLIFFLVRQDEILRLKKDTSYNGIEMSNITNLVNKCQPDNEGGGSRLDFAGKL